MTIQFRTFQSSKEEMVKNKMIMERYKGKTSFLEDISIIILTVSDSGNSVGKLYYCGPHNLLNSGK